MCPLDCRTCERLSARPTPRPTLYMPVMPPLGLIDTLRLALTRYRCRREIKRLLRLSNARLVDLGFRRVELERALSRPRGDNPCFWLVDRRRDSNKNE